VDELNAAFEAKYGRPADLLTGPGYACVQIAAQAIENAGTLDTAAVRDAIAAIDMMTVVGPVTFNEDGTGNVYDPLIQWLDYEQVVVWPPELATHDLAYPAPPFDQR
jgi:branched-chain amino acid transport system substrate-binding protein